MVRFEILSGRRSADLPFTLWKNKADTAKSVCIWLEICLISVKLRTVPTFVTAHTFCASRDTQVSYVWFLLIQGCFCAVENYAEKTELSKCLLTISVLSFVSRCSHFEV